MVYGSDKSIGPVRLIVKYKNGDIKDYGLIIKMPAPYLIEIDEQNKVIGYRNEIGGIKIEDSEAGA